MPKINRRYIEQLYIKLLILYMYYLLFIHNPKDMDMLDILSIIYIKYVQKPARDIIQNIQYCEKLSYGTKTHFRMVHLNLFLRHRTSRIENVILKNVRPNFSKSAYKTYIHFCFIATLSKIFSIQLEIKD